MQNDLDQAMREVFEQLSSMSDPDFQGLLERHRNGAISQALSSVEEFLGEVCSSEELLGEYADEVIQQRLSSFHSTFTRQDHVQNMAISVFASLVLQRLQFSGFVDGLEAANNPFYTMAA